MFLGPDTFVAAVDTRTYWFTPAVGDDAPLEPQVGSFNIKPDTWTRFWAFVDFDNDKYSYWIADDEDAQNPGSALD